MKITLTDWAMRNYSPPPSRHTLRLWANSGQIVPPAEKVGKTWMVDEHAVRVPLAQPSSNVVSLSPRAQGILKTV